MEKKFYFLFIFFLLLSISGFAQFQEVAKITDYPDIKQNSDDRFGQSVAVDGDFIVVGSPNYKGIGCAYVFYDNGVTYDTLAILTPSNGAFDDQFGRSVAIQGDVIVVGSPNNDATTNQAGAVYVFVKPIDGWQDMTETVTLNGTTVGSGDYFGWSVDIDSDQIVASAYYQGNNGAAYVYEKPLTGWQDATNETAILTASVGSSGDQFGHAVSISGDIVVVGTPSVNAPTNDEGIVYLYEKSGANWTSMTETAQLTLSDAAEDDYFGLSVAVDGDVVIGATKNKNGNQGAVYLFEKPLSGWVSATETAKLTASDGAGGDYFGNAISLKNDIIAVGATYDDDAGVNTGVVYVFEKPVAGWISATETAKLTDANADLNQNLGSSVSVGIDQIISGAVFSDQNGESSGRVVVFNKPPVGYVNAVSSVYLFPLPYTNISYLNTGHTVAIDGNIAVIGNDIDYSNYAVVMEFDGNNWIRVATLTPSDGVHGDAFGYAVSVFGDVIVVGAYIHGLGGAAYVFEKPSTGWEDMTETAKLLASDAGAEDCFGSAVDIYGDDIVIGAWSNDEHSTASGAAYVFTKPLSGWVSTTETAKLYASDASGADYLGFSVAISDGVIALGAKYDDDNGMNSGSVYVYEKPLAGWVNASETAKLSASDGVANDYFGSTLDVDGEVVVVGVKDHDPFAISNAGAAYIFEKPGAVWSTMSETQKITASSPDAVDMFGASVAVSGNYIAIGTHGDDDLALNSGAVYIFSNASGNWTEVTKLTASGSVQYDSFGEYVAICDNYVIGGAMDVDVEGSYNAGSAYLFQAPLTWTGETNTDWNVSGNWDFNVVPHFYDDVYIASAPANQPETIESADCYDFELEATASMHLYSDDGGNGSLIIRGSYTGAADFEYYRYMTGNQWHMISSPFTDNAIDGTLDNSSFVNDGTNYKFKSYDEASDSWSAEYTLLAPGGNMGVGQAYAGKISSDGAVYFAGTPNVADNAIALTADGNGWNLLGNPYTSAVAITVIGTDSEDYLLNATNTALLDPSFTALYVWVEDIADPTNLDNYKVINNAGSGSLVQDYLQVGQGFFVKAASSGNFNINRNMQSHQIAAPFKQSANANWTGIHLTASSDGQTISTDLALNEQMTYGLDVSYDAGYMNTHPHFAMYSKLMDDNGQNFALQCLPTNFESLEVAIGLDASAGSEITFKAAVTNLPLDYVVVLEDRELGVFTKLETEADYYTVTLDNASVGIGRFYVHASFKSALSIDELEDASYTVIAQASSNQLLINGNVEESTTARVYTIQGKLVGAYSLEKGEQNIVPFAEQSGVYVVHIQDRKGVVSQKINWIN